MAQFQQSLQLLCLLAHLLNIHDIINKEFNPVPNPGQAWVMVLRYLVKSQPHGSHMSLTPVHLTGWDANVINKQQHKTGKVPDLPHKFFIKTCIFSIQQKINKITL